MMLEGCECWRECCDLGPHDCICGNDCEPPEPEAVTRAREDMVAALKAERDELRAVVERVRALADDSVRAAEEGPTVFSGLPFLAALLARDVHAAIDGEGDRDE